MAPQPLPTLEELAWQVHQLTSKFADYDDKLVDYEDMKTRLADLEDQLPQTQQTLAARFDRHCALLEGLLVEHFQLPSAQSLVLVRQPGQARVRQVIRNDDSLSDRIVVARYVLYYILQLYEVQASFPVLRRRYGMSNHLYSEVLFRCEVDRRWRNLRRAVERDFLNATGRSESPVSEPSPEILRGANVQRHRSVYRLSQQASLLTAHGGEVTG